MNETSSLSMPAGAAAPTGPTVGSETPLPVWSSQDLCQGGRRALIEHGGELYRLLITAKGRLLLTK